VSISTVVIGLLALVGVVLVWGAWRWHKIRTSGGITVALRWRMRHDGDIAGWHLGIGRYRGEQFLWFRVLSLRNGPDRVLSREDLHITERRKPSKEESYTLPAAATVLRCKSTEGMEIEIAMGPGALTGFLSWLESAPPGHQVPWAS